MKSAASWNIEGVAPQARETAREAARRAGLSVGEWLNTAIVDSAGDVPATTPGEQENPRRLAEAIGRLSARLEELIEGRASEMASEAAGAKPIYPQLPASPPDWASGIDQAVAEIAARQHALDAGATRPGLQSGFDLEPLGIPLQNVSGLEQQLRAITQQIESLRRPCAVETDVAALRQELAGIRQTLADAMPRCAVEVLETQIRALASRVDRGRESSDGIALAGVERRLASVCETLNRLAPAENLAGLEEEVGALARKIDTVATQGTDPATMQQLETAIAELRRVSERVASGEALTKLANEVRTLSEKIDRFDYAGSGRDALSALERRMEVLAGTLTDYATNVSRSSVPDVEALMKGVSERLERVQSMRAEQDALEQIEAQIGRLAEKIDASDERMAQFGGFERTLADLFMQIEDSRAGAIEAAERAAKVAARELTTAEAADQAAVELLHRELADLRGLQSESDRRTQDSLEAVHETMRRLVDRLSSRDAHKSGNTAVQTAEPVLPATGSPSIAPPAAPASAPAPASSVRASQLPALRPAPAERRTLESDIPADTPLEPGSGPPQGRGASAAERIAASEAALGAAKSSAAPERTDKANFIAAARRAAQAAAADAAAHEGVEASASDEQSGSFAKILGKHRKPFLMGAAALVVLAGGLHFATGFLSNSSTARVHGAPAVAKSPTAREHALDAAQLADQRRTAAPASEETATSRDALLVSPAPATSLAAAAPTSGFSPPLPGTAAFSYGPPVKLASGDVTGSLAKAPNTVLASPAPTAALLAPAAAPADAGKLPAAIGGALRTAAQHGDAGAAYEVALRYAEGRGVPLSLEEAARWFRRAADLGLAPAQYRLGSLYEKGQGLKKDLEAARRLYTTAAEKGNAKAMHNLAVLYAEGLDGKPDFRTAAQWFRKAAERGIADSQFNLGIIFAKGIGTEQNLAESYKWFALAAVQGDTDAARKRDDIAARLDEQALAAARLAVQTFTPESQPDEAVNVKAPPGGWDRTASAAAPVKHKPVSNRKTGAS
jgi:localization factor PodJL